jgi:hypothetical protein
MKNIEITAFEQDDGLVRAYIVPVFVLDGDGLLAVGRTRLVANAWITVPRQKVEQTHAHVQRAEEQARPIVNQQCRRRDTTHTKQIRKSPQILGQIEPCERAVRKLLGFNDDYVVLGPHGLVEFQVEEAVDWVCRVVIIAFVNDFIRVYF